MMLKGWWLKVGSEVEHDDDDEWVGGGYEITTLD